MLYYKLQKKKRMFVLPFCLKCLTSKFSQWQKNVIDTMITNQNCLNEIGYVFVGIV